MFLFTPVTFHNKQCGAFSRPLFYTYRCAAQKGAVLMHPSLTSPSFIASPLCFPLCCTLASGGACGQSQRPACQQGTYPSEKTILGHFSTFPFTYSSQLSFMCSVRHLSVQHTSILWYDNRSGFFLSHSMSGGTEDFTVSFE